MVMCLFTINSSVICSSQVSLWWLLIKTRVRDFWKVYCWIGSNSIRISFLAFELGIAWCVFVRLHSIETSATEFSGFIITIKLILNIVYLLSLFEAPFYKSKCISIIEQKSLFHGYSLTKGHDLHGSLQYTVDASSLYYPTCIRRNGTSCHRLVKTLEWTILLCLEVLGCLWGYFYVRFLVPHRCKIEQVKDLS